MLNYIDDYREYSLLDCCMQRRKKTLIETVAYHPTTTICSVDNNKCVSGCPGTAKSELNKMITFNRHNTNQCNELRLNILGAQKQQRKLQKQKENSNV